VKGFLNMKRSLFVIFCIFALGVSFVTPQTKSQPISQLPEFEPFDISRGKYFSASSSNQTFNSEKGKSTVRSEEVIDDFEEALAIIRKNHVNGNKIDLNELAKTSITAMLRTLDPHSNYFDSAEYEELLTDQQSEYYGIGSTIVNYDKNGVTDTFVISTFPESSANRSNLRFGDKIVAVNGEKVNGKNSALVRDKVRGKIGSTVRLTIERADNKKVEIIELKRGRIPQPSLPDAYILRPGIGYIDLSNGFNYTTNEELSVAIKELQRQGMNSLILDLRDNPGGILEQSVRVAEKFLPAGSTIVTQRGRFRIDNRTWKSNNKAAETMPLVLLVNGNSASASEIVAGAIQDYDRAIIVGEKTFGKGLVQSIFNLPYSSGLTLTTARYFTPSGRSIQRDYANGNLYDYFNHKTDFNESAKSKLGAQTISGRKMFGGDGISPDEIVKTQTLNQAELNLLYPIFFFTVELINGRIKGLESYQTKGQIHYGQRIRPVDLTVTDEVFAAFDNYIGKEKSANISTRIIETERAFIKKRIRFNLIMAVYGSVSANQVLIEDDTQVSKAVESLPRAQQLALTARKAEKFK
jgi:carboxyl-terminal processing protease